MQIIIYPFTVNMFVISDPDELPVNLVAMVASTVISLYILWICEEMNTPDWTSSHLGERRPVRPRWPYLAYNDQLYLIRTDEYCNSPWAMALNSPLVNLVVASSHLESLILPHLVLSKFWPTKFCQWEQRELVHPKVLEAVANDGLKPIAHWWSWKSWT